MSVYKSATTDKMPWSKTRRNKIRKKTAATFYDENKNRYPYMYQKLHGRRFFVYKDIKHDGKKLIGFLKPFAILAPQKTTSNLPAPAIFPFVTPTWDVSNGYQNMPLEKITKYDTTTQQVLTSYHVTDDTQGTWLTGGTVHYDIPADAIFSFLNRNNLLPTIPTTTNISRNFSILIEGKTYKGYTKNTQTNKWYRTKKNLFTAIKAKTAGGIIISNTNLDTVTYPTIKQFTIKIKNNNSNDIIVKNVYFSSQNTRITLQTNLKNGVTIKPNNESTIEFSSYDWQNKDLHQNIVNQPIYIDIIEKNIPYGKGHTPDQPRTIRYKSNLTVNYKGDRFIPDNTNRRKITTSPIEVWNSEEEYNKALRRRQFAIIGGYA